MAEESELVGGISAELRADHSKLPGDLAAAERLVQQWAQQVASVELRVAGTAQGGRPAAQQPPPRPVFGASVQTNVAAQQGQTALQRRINEELAKTGEAYNEQTGEIERATAAIVAQHTTVRAHRAAAVADLRQEETQKIQSARRVRAVKEDSEEEGGLTGMTRRAAFAMREEERSGAAIQATRVRTGRQAYNEGERQRRTELTATRKHYDSLATLAEQYFDEQDERLAKVTPQNAAAAKFAQPLQVDRSEQALLRQRQAEELRGIRERQRVEREAQVQLATQDRQDSQERLRNLSYEQQRTGGASPTSATFAPVAGPARAAELAARSNVDMVRTPQQRAEMSRQQAARDEAGRRENARVRAQDEERQSAARAASDRERDAAAQKTALGGRTATEAQRERAVQASIERQRVGITASGQTGRTAAFGLGALFGGTRGEGIEARARQASAERDLSRAEREAEPIRRRLAEYDEDIVNTSGKVQQGYVRRRQAFLNNKDNADIIEREVKASKNLVAANQQLEKLQGFRSVAQNLLAGAAGGAAFGIAMGAASEAIHLATTTLGAFIDEQGGFASTSTRVTGAIAQQTAALHGNVDAALATVEAQAGLNKGAADYLNVSLRQTAQIKAGALAQQQASELFRASAGGGGTPEGLFGGFGGVGGSPFLAQQLGGGKGFSEIIQGDLSNLSRQQEQGNDLFAKIGQGLSYLTNPDFRQTIDNLSAQQGRPTPSQSNPIGNALGLSLPIGGASALLGGLGDQIFRGGQAPPSQQQAEVERVAQAQDANGPIQQYLKNLNENIKRGGGQGRVEFTADPEMRRLGMASAAAAGDLNGVTSASQGFVVTLNGAIASTEQYTAALTAAAAAASRPTPEVLMGQFAQTNPALINAAGRQQQFAANVQLPAQQALQNLATPLKPVGTGFAAANAEEQARVADTQKESQRLQDQLNARYEQGRQIIQDTYRASVVKNFGEAAGQQFDSLLTKIKTTGQAIADIQSSISNEQAAYQTAQYNYQLGIAKRTLSDIGGLTGKNFGAGQSYLGQLEKENLALSRQGQQLQFNLSQRSINFQRAVAGFTAPGLTPEERAARIEQANIEADIAQKQLNIGKNIFQNQVQIVDIQNLRQGADLVKQIALLEQGRQVTIDVQVKTEELERLIAIQQEQVAEAGTYIAQVESLVQAAFGQIQQLEVAAGSAVAGIANKVLEQFGLTLNGINNELEEFAERNSAPPPNQRDDYRNDRNGQTPQGQYAPPPNQRDNQHGASGMLGRTSGSTDITVGEAGTEEVAVLRNPRAYLGGGGGSNVSVVFTGEITVRSEDDLRKMEQFVESAVVRALGRGSSLQGLRLS